jgi:hypothetical protein
VKTLHIYSGDGLCAVDAGPGDHFGYVIGTGRFSDPCLIPVNDAGRLQALATDQAGTYCDHVFAANRYFVQNRLLYKNELSLYFLTDFSCKRTELFKTFQDYCNVRLIRDIVAEHHIQQVVCHSLSAALVGSLRSALTAVRITGMGTTRPGLRHTPIKYLISSFGFFFRALLCVIGMRIGLDGHRRRKIKHATDKAAAGDVFLTRYPLHLNNKLEEDKFGAAAAGQRLLVHLLTDGYHQQVSVIKFFRFVQALAAQERVQILDRYLGVRDVLYGMWQTIALSLKLGRLSKSDYTIGGISLKQQFIEELSFSFSRLPRLLMWVGPVRKFAAVNRVERFHYYLHEYSYGRLFTYALRRHSAGTSLLAYQHGPAATIKLVCRAGQGELSGCADGIISFYTPDLVYVEDEYSRAIYREAGYPKVEAMKCVHRLSYLEKVDRSSSRWEAIVLVAPGLHDGEFLLGRIFPSILQRGDQKYVLKPHPRADNSYLDHYRAGNLEISNRPIYELLGQASKVYVTYSSVGIEAFILGLDVEIIQAPGVLCESPLLDDAFKRNISTLRYQTHLSAEY